MSALIRAWVCVALLSVLGGTPIAAAVCAAWCDTSAASHAGHQAAAPTAAQAEDCHGSADSTHRITGERAPECATAFGHGAGAALNPPRLDLAAAAAHLVAPILALPASALVTPSGSAPSPQLTRPVSANRVLRI